MEIFEEIYNRALVYREMYRHNQCTIEEAKDAIMPYINLVNEKSKNIAAKYSQKPKKITFSGFVR